MEGNRAEMIHALEFSCQTPLKFYERCSNCARFGDDCIDLQLGKDILRGKKKLVYARGNPEDSVHADSFNCLAPLHYFEKARSKCPHDGRCREEGLLLALLSGKKSLGYTQKNAVELLPRKVRRKKTPAQEVISEKVAL